MMVCRKCGGLIALDKSCERCGIAYDDLIDSIEHDEMKRLFVKIDKLHRQRKSFNIEESLLACELVNSSLLVPAIEIEGHLIPMIVNDKKGREYVLLFTDREEYDSYVWGDVKVLTNSFRNVLELLDDFDVAGFVINASGFACRLGRKYLDQYFLGE